MTRILRVIAVGFWLIGAFASSAAAGTTGKLRGTVTDAKSGEPVAAATVVVVGQKLGAYTDARGQYSILNIPAGTYVVTVSRLGFASVTTSGVVVSADNTTDLDVRLGQAELEMEEVVVVAERPLVDVNLTSSKTTLTSEQIQELPVQELQDVVNLQAGVVDGHFRGGRLGEVQYQVDGVSVNNAFDNKSSVRVDRSLLQEVQVISGTFDAEYGQAMSGVVNAVLKQGTETFRWNAELFGGGFLFPGREGARLTDDTVRPLEIQNYQLSASGPLPFPETVALVSGRRYVFDDYVFGARIFAPTDSADRANAVFTPTGDGEKVPLGFTREWSGVAKITNTSVPGAKINYQALVNWVKGRRNNWAFRYNPDGLSTQRTFSIAHGLDWTHTLAEQSFLDLNIRHNYIEYEDFVFEDPFDSRYDDAGPPISDINYEEGAVIQGYEFTRYFQRTNALLLKGSVVSQVNASHQVKAGAEFQFPKVEFGTPGHLVYTQVDGVETLVRKIDDPPDYPGIRTYHPVLGAAFVQDQVELDDITLRAGVRLDYFNARARGLPGDLRNPANSIEGAPAADPVTSTAKTSLSPRLGVAYPITDRVGVHFAYGHFYQFPAIGTIFANADYGRLANLQAGGADFGVLGNPDVKPEQTVQYEFGYKHALTSDLGLEGTVFYKDIRDLVGVEFITTYNNAEYARLTNVDFGSVAGFTLALDHRRLGPAVLSLDYTWQQGLGNSSDPRETATRADAGEDPRPRLLPFNWDQRHTLNMTVSLNRPAWTTSMVVRAGSGQPYTPQIETGFGYGLEQNSGRKPASFTVDLRAERYFTTSGMDLSLFGRVFNLLDTRFNNGAVFADTGSPYYSRFDSPALDDPTRFFTPRRIEVGLTLRPMEKEAADAE